MISNLALFADRASLILELPKRHIGRKRNSIRPGWALRLYASPGASALAMNVHEVERAAISGRGLGWSDYHEPGEDSWSPALDIELAPSL
ncbi:MAG: hypothetical protein JWQ95_6371 [Sphaerisporangium sp.]|jgi:hypothetical protein|nr:hypothetical protein [Sphaerisporangium sp.]